MGKIISGGLKNEPKEGWGSYIARNINQFPATALSTFQSGFGGGDILRLLNQKIGVPQIQGQLPTYQEAREQYNPIVGQERPEDAPAQLVLKELGLAAATGGLSSLGNAGRFALGSAASHAGGAVGKELGGLVGKQLGDQDIGELVGGIGGGLTGATAAQAGRRLLPSKAFENDRLIVPENTLDKVIDKLTQWGKGGIGAALGGALGGLSGGKIGAAVGGLAGGLLQSAGKEVGIAIKVFKEQPYLFKQYQKTLSNLTKQNIPKTVARLNQLGKKIEKSQKREGKIISGGLKSEYL